MAPKEKLQTEGSSAGVREEGEEGGERARKEGRKEGAPQVISTAIEKAGIENQPCQSCGSSRLCSTPFLQQQHRTKERERETQIGKKERETN